MVEYLHYTGDESPFVLQRNMQYTQDNRLPKPKGLWLSVGSAWRDWCEGEQWNLDRVKLAYEIRLDPNANILRLSTANQIKSLARQFRQYSIGIDWQALATMYDGIIIDPYCWSARLDPETMFYYGWDCASGCI